MWYEDMPHIFVLLSKKERSYRVATKAQAFFLETTRKPTELENKNRDQNWTMLILEAAPSLHNFRIYVYYFHSLNPHFAWLQISI
jgi:DNA-binding transcriptional regulator PaaX